MGYVLLAMIVTIVSGQSFADFLKARIFDPLGMKHTVADDASRLARHKLAHGYWKKKDQFKRWDYPMLTTGDGDLFSTLDDLFLWDQALNTEQLVSKAELAQAFTSGTTNDGTSVGYGFGWCTNVFPYFDEDTENTNSCSHLAVLRHVAHGDGGVADNNYMIRLLDTLRTIIVLTNHLGVPGPRIRSRESSSVIKKTRLDGDPN
jgi:CubicO group peptidase (beta-lactamase class C family)